MVAFLLLVIVASFVSLPNKPVRQLNTREIAVTVLNTIVFIWALGYLVRSF